MVKTIAPVNIALIKYWGKTSTDPVRPSTPSISLTLKEFYTVTEVAFSKGFTFTLNDENGSPSVLEKTRGFVRLFQKSGELNLAISSTNHVPTAAGLASSASGFAALGLALHHFYQTPSEDLIQMTAKGSGSAVRSLPGGAVMWHTDGTITPVDFGLENYQMAVVMIDTREKKQSSREAMKHVQSTKEYTAFIARNHQRADAMVNAMGRDDFDVIGRLMEESTLDMHSLGAFSRPPFMFLKSETMTLWQDLVTARHKGLNAYATADAGPNLKILFPKTENEHVKTFLKNYPWPVVFTEFTREGARLWQP